MSLRRRLATSSHPAARAARGFRRQVRNLAMPAPRVATVPLRIVYVSLRAAFHTFMRIVVAEPIFKSYCTRHGRRLHTGPFVHWIQGRGRMILGDDVLFDGKSSFAFAARFTDAPTLRVGNRTGVGHDCVFVVADSITIGDDCRVAGGVTFRDSPGHPLDPEARRRGDPPDPDTIKPIVIENNVWIGARAMIAGGVRIGEGSVISSGAVVGSDVPPYSLMAGNPARRIGTITPPPAGDPESAPAVNTTEIA